MGVYLGRSTPLPPPSVSCPLSLCNLLDNFSTRQETHRKLHQLWTAVSLPSVPYSRFSTLISPARPPILFLSLVYPLSYMGNVRYLTVPGIVISLNAGLTYGTCITMSCRLTCAVFATCSGLWDLQCFCTNVIHWCNYPLSSLLLTPHLLVLLACLFVGDIFVTFLPSYNTG